MLFAMKLLLSACLSLLVLGCDAPAASKAASALPMKPVLVHGEVPVADFVAKAERAHPGKVLVYVGASWCEPCRYFHDALVAGSLDRLLSGMQVIEYDLDLHKAQLVEAGYSSRMIPLFVLPNADGRASERQISGSVKGAQAVPENLVPRLSTLLRGSREQ